MSHKKNNSFLLGKGFYGVLAVCLIAIGVAGWAAMSSFKEIENLENENPEYIDGSPSYNIESEQKEPVQNTVEDEPYESDEPTAAEPVLPPVADSFISPAGKGEITKGFDSSILQYSATFGDMRIHLGVDILADLGSDVVSAGKGTVTKIYSDVLLGRTVEVDHGNGIVFKYCGLSDDITVKEGYTLEQGQKLATLSGSPGESGDVAHLHIEATKNGTPIDPAELIGLLQN